MKGRQLLIKTDRCCAWVLVISFLVFYVSGYGLTRKIISPEVAKLIHDVLLPVPTALAFALHSAYGMHISLKRWKKWGRGALAALTVYSLLIVGGVLAFELTRTPTVKVEVPQTIEFE